jgi:hypothetical protein
VVEKQDTKSKTEKIKNRGRIKIVGDLVNRLHGNITPSRLVTMLHDLFSASYINALLKVLQFLTPGRKM